MYDEECKTAIEEMKKAWEKWLVKGRRENEEQENVLKRKEEKNVNEKKLYIRKVTESFEEDKMYNNTRKMNQTTNHLRKDSIINLTRLGKKRRTGNEY